MTKEEEYKTQYEVTATQETIVNEKGELKTEKEVLVENNKLLKQIIQTIK